MYLNFTKHPEVTRCLHSHSAEVNKQNSEDNHVLFTPSTNTLREYFAGRIKEEHPFSQLTTFPVTFDSDPDRAGGAQGSEEKNQRSLC